MPRQTLTVPLLLVAAAVAGQEPAPRPPRPWLGVSLAASEPPRHPEVTAVSAVLLQSVVPGSPAAKAGLRAGDLVFAADGVPFDRPPNEAVAHVQGLLAAKKVGETLLLRIARVEVESSVRVGDRDVPAGGSPGWRDLPGFLDEAEPGTSVEAKARKLLAIREVTVALEARPEDTGPARRLPSPAEFRPDLEAAATDEERLAEGLVKAVGIEKDYADTLARLARTHDRPDAFRLRIPAYVHRSPWRMERVAGEISASLAKAAPSPDWDAGLLVETLASWADAAGEPAPLPRLRSGLDLDGHAEQIASVLAEARRHHERAFREIPAGDRAPLEAALHDVSEVLAGSHVLSEDTDPRRRERTRRALELAACVDWTALFQAARIAATLVQPAFLASLREDLVIAAEGRVADATLFEKETPVGRIVFGGYGRSWHREKDCAAIVDLGGDDFYAQNAGSSTGFALPVALVVDFAGDDAYEATRERSQGTGWLGVGILADLSGNDTYLGPRWCQGCGALGVGLLLDAAGDDVYVGSRYDQGFAAHQAAGFFLDAGGDDRYGTRQGVAQGLSWDETAVVFVDAGGDDVYEGGGFFSQGASAHNGFCLFVDRGGKDTYRHAPGVARAGPNDYHRGASFSLGLDLGGAEDNTGPAGRNNAILTNGRFGFAADLPGDVAAALRDGAYRALVKATPAEGGGK